MSAWLVVLSGLPGVGKTSVARALCAASGAAHLRIDTIEAVLRAAGERFEGDRGDLAYRVAYAQARDMLRVGRCAVIDAVHGWDGAAALWTGACADTGARLCRVALRCADEGEHRRRIETRASDIPGQPPPDWASVTARPFAPLADPDLALDTARLTPEAAVARILAAVS